MIKILLMLLFPILLTASEISGELTFVGPVGPIKIGSFVEARVLLGPQGENYLKDLEKTVGNNLFEGFYLQEVRNPQVLQGGDGYLEADLTLVMIAPLKPGDKFMWKIGEKSISLNLKGFLSAQPDLNPKAFIILEQAVKRNLFLIKLGIILLALLILALGYFLWKRVKNKTLKREIARKKQEKIDFWKDLILNAKERPQLEQIYIERELWLTLIPSLRDKADNFFSTIEKHQYRPCWTDEELEEIMESLKRIMHGV
ncbi:MAG: hypothetical protein E2O68_02240 [Deltaproteobacteria bacterium]|nr:MAG: hypothetical protein E2O68_02240 [Deltaproteobacteria bacterium]